MQRIDRQRPSGRGVRCLVHERPGGRAELLTDAVVAACDAGDGLKDGMIFNTRHCAFDPASLACKDAKADACLAPDQVSALARAFAGPRNSRGGQSYAPFPWDSGIAPINVSIPGILRQGRAARSVRRSTRRSMSMRSSFECRE